MALLGVGTQVGVLLPFSRAQEAEADLLGLDLMADAGFDPSASIELWQHMEALSEGNPPEFVSPHPDTKNRISALEGRMPKVDKLYLAAAARGRKPVCRR